MITQGKRIPNCVFLGAAHLDVELAISIDTGVDRHAMVFSDIFQKITVQNRLVSEILRFFIKKSFQPSSREMSKNNQGL